MPGNIQNVAQHPLSQNLRDLSAEGFAKAAAGKRSGDMMTKGVLVIGGGIAGIQSALDLASSGVKVYLVEKTPSIGGRMAQLDKTFPTMDCSI